MRALKRAENTSKRAEKWSKRAETGAKLRETSSEWLSFFTQVARGKTIAIMVGTHHNRNRLSVSRLREK